MHEIKERIAFLKSYLVERRQTAYVLGISGGVDSLTAGLLTQRAVREVREDGHAATFIAVRLPYGAQADEHDAAAAVAAIDPDRVLTVDIKPAADSLMAAVLAGGITRACAITSPSEKNPTTIPSRSRLASRKQANKPWQRTGRNYQVAPGASALCIYPIFNDQECLIQPHPLWHLPRCARFPLPSHSQVQGSDVASVLRIRSGRGRGGGVRGRRAR